MPERDIASSAVGDNEATFQDFSVAEQTLDSAGDQKETTHFNHSFNKQLGYYKSIPELKSAIDAKARWTIGKGFTSNEITEIALSAIKGHGKDTFNSILENQERMSEIAGDSFAHIIRDNEGNLINLKPMPQLQIVANRAGLIIRYEQLDRQNKKAVKKFAPEEIFHLSRDRVGDEIHGISVIHAVEENILMRNEAMEDYKTMLHRNIYPVRDWILDTDNAAEIAAFKAKVAESKYKGEDLFYPKGTVESEIKAVAPNSTLNPLPWITQLTQKFYQEVGTPQIVVGGSNEFTEATAKIVLIAWEQTVGEKQLSIEEQVLSQINLEIKLERPVTIQNELMSDDSKSETMQASTPEDTSVTNVGVNQ